MEVVPVDVERPDLRVVIRAVTLLRAGEVIAGPTDTVYGFLARPTVPRAMETLRRLKGREGPFIHLVHSLSAAQRITRDVTDATWERVSRVWPGPVTIVLPGAGGQRVALRMPNLTLLITILEKLGEPLISTSANRADDPDPVSADQVMGPFAHEAVPLLLDGGPALSRQPSTLVDLTGLHARVLRHGAGNAAPLLDPPSETP
jgi:L-threonylcarbamoyladenylate synthase